MKRLLVTCLVSTGASLAIAQTSIECTKPHHNSTQPALWPPVQVSPPGQLCFDVQKWISFRGQNCVSNGKTVSWEGVVIVTLKGESQGRETTRFRVVNPVVANDRIRYAVEWSRSDAWHTLQSVEVNLATGQGLEHFPDTKKTEELKCRTTSEKGSAGSGR